LPVKKTVLPKPTYKIDEEAASVSETYTAGEEKVKLTISGEGSVTIHHAGDGSADITTRVYVDGTLEESIAGNEPGIITVGFTTSLEIRTYAAAAVTASNSSLHIVGWRF